MKHRITTTLLALGTCASLLTVPAWADTTSGAGNASSGAASAETAFPTTEGTIDTSLTGTVRLDYQDADEEGSAPVAGAEFTFYKVADIDTVLTEEQETASKAEKAASKAESAASSAKADTGSAAESTAESTISTAEKSVLLKGAVLVPLIDGVEISADTDPASIEEEVVKAYQSDVEKGATYTGTTGKDGTATVTDMDLGAYLAVETKPAAEHFASTPFLFMLPYTTGGTTWTYGVSAQPKPLPAGDLVLKKTVTGTAGDTKKDFNFVVTFSKDGTYHYTKSDGTKGTVKSGGSVKLKSGETATIDTIPVGTTYTVKESEANADGYKTTVTGNTGTIKRTVKAEADFTNHKDATPTPNKTVSPTPKTTTSTPTTPSDRTRGQRSLTSVKTGDAMKLGLALAVAALAAICLGVYAVRKKKASASAADTSASASASAGVSQPKDAKAAEKADATKETETAKKGGEQE